MQFTVRAIDKNLLCDWRDGNYRMPMKLWAQCEASDQRLFVDERAPLPVVEIALLFGKRRRIAFDEPALDEPARGARGEHEQARKPELASALLDLVQERLAVPFAAEIGIHRQRGELARLFRRERVQRGAADNDAIVLCHHEALDLHLEAFARTPDEHTLVLERRDDRQNSSDIVDGRAAQLCQRCGGDHGSDAITGKELEEERAVVMAGEQVSAFDTVVARSNRARQIV